MFNIDKETTIAVVGASSDPTKYGNIITKDLKDKGFKVFPVNPKGGEIHGLKVYPSLKDIPEKVDIVDMVVPADVGLKIIDEVKELGLKQIWFQPGSERGDLLKYCEDSKLDYIAHKCIMVETRQ